MESMVLDKMREKIESLENIIKLQDEKIELLEDRIEKSEECLKLRDEKIELLEDSIKVKDERIELLGETIKLKDEKLQERGKKIKTLIRINWRLKENRRTITLNHDEDDCVLSSFKYFSPSLYTNVLFHVKYLSLL